MPELVQGPRTGGFVVSEGNGAISREQIILLADNGILLPGTILGKITASSKYVPVAPAATDGSEVAAAILYAKKDTTGSDREATVVARNAEVNAALLIWPEAITEPQKNTAMAELEAVGIIDR